MLIQKAIILFLHKKQSHSIYIAQKFEKEKPWQTAHTKLWQAKLWQIDGKYVSI